MNHSKLVQLATGIVRRIRPEMVIVEEVVMPTPVFVSAPVRKREKTGQYRAIPCRTPRTFFQPYGEAKEKHGIMRVSLTDMVNMDYYPDGPRIEGCSCKDFNPPVANLDVWSCKVCDPREEPEEDEHTHVKEWHENMVVVTW